MERRIARLESDIVRIQADVFVMKSALERLSGKVDGLHRVEEWAERAWHLVNAGIVVGLIACAFRIWAR